MDDGKVRKTIKYKFNSDEIVAESELLAQEMAEVSDLEAEKKRVADNFKGKISHVQLSMAERAKKIRDGYEYRSIECTPVPDYEEKLMRFYDDDMALIDERPLTPDELQQRFEFEQQQGEIAREDEENDGPFDDQAGESTAA